MRDVFLVPLGEIAKHLFGQHTIDADGPEHPLEARRSVDRVSTDLQNRSSAWMERGHHVSSGRDVIPTPDHIDDICRFTDHKTLVLIKERNKRDINYQPLEENWERVQDFRRRYNNAVRGCPCNHSRIDYLMARPGGSWEARLLVRLRYAADVYGLYSCCLAGPPILLLLFH